MTFDKWLQEKSSTYKLKVVLVERPTDFNAYEYRISDPRGQALGFIIYLNARKEPSIFTTDTFTFGQCHIAEGVSSDEILEAANDCLDGNLRIKRSALGQFELEFAHTRGKLPKDATLTDEIVADYRKGYELRVS